MDVFWSATARGFFLAGTQPSDAVAVTPEQHRQLLAGQAAGQEIAANEDGAPVLRDPVPPAMTADEARAQRDRRLAASDWTQIADSPLAAPERAAWATYRQALRDVPEQEGFPAAVTWPDPPG
ncbi:phage tail protein [Rhodovarius crocodyli]|uniref:Phage tail protein n=1 Tax=Rhodovarius crocodyli TaxID=1979269 RepID=A0A437MC91_9PROT|nr:tail fiber assembly protein [Rhodovarius crocodyli]RVT95264.1 phage tail protein [Rhodovarius crocodyli]